MCIDMAKVFFDDYGIPVNVITKDQDKIFYNLEAFTDSNRVCDAMISILTELKRYPQSFIKSLKMKFTICN